MFQDCLIPWHVIKNDDVLVLCSYCPVSENSTGSFSLTDPHWGKPCTEQLSESQTVACLEQMKLLAEKHKKTVAQVTWMISGSQWEMWSRRWLWLGMKKKPATRTYFIILEYECMSRSTCFRAWQYQIKLIGWHATSHEKHGFLTLRQNAPAIYLADVHCETLFCFVWSRWPWIGAFARAQFPFRAHGRWSRPRWR